MTLKPVATLYSCRNPGQVALLWAHQPAPFGHGWIDVKQEPLVRLSEVEALQAELDVYRQLFSDVQRVQVNPYAKHVTINGHDWSKSKGADYDGTFEGLTTVIRELLK